MQEHYFSAENIQHDWQDFHEDLTLYIDKGIMTCVVGPSGSGKSTLLRIIAGLEKPAAKTRIILDGQDITNTPPAKRNIGLVAQNRSLFLHMTVEDNVGYGLRCKGISKKESREQAKAYLANFELSGFEKRYPETLSGGEAQRVALARTLIIKPKLVLFDEPLSALDAPLRKKLASDIRKWQKELSFTGIMVTHDIAEAKNIGDYIVLLEQGKITWQGAAKEFDENFMSKNNATN